MKSVGLVVGQSAVIAAWVYAEFDHGAFFSAHISSTAALGFVALPMYQLLAIGDVIALQRQPRRAGGPDSPGG